MGNIEGKLPIGFGTANIKGDICESVKTAVRAGCRLIDTAYNYNSEKDVGKALNDLISNHEIGREDLIIQTKLAPRKHGYYPTKECFHESLDNLKLEYVDNYFIHWPVPRGMELTYCERNSETWSAMEEEFHEGRVRMLSVSNFLERHLLQIETFANIPISYNQLEIHPMFQQIGLSRFCKSKGIKIQSWSPLGNGTFSTDCKDKLASIGEKYNKSYRQVCLRWNVQMGNTPIFSSGNPDHILENMDIFDFELSEMDMEEIRKMNTSDHHLQIWCYDNQMMF